MNDTQRLQHIAAFEIADSTRSLAEQLAEPEAAPMSPALATDTTLAAQAAVTGGSLVAFAQGVSRQNREDVMDSLLFATLVANKAANPETQSDKWYQQFNTVLATLGWFSAHWRYARYNTTRQRFTMDQAGLEIVKSAIAAAALPGPAAFALLKVAQDALTALSANKEPLRLFERQTRTHRGGNFRVASCSESEDGLVNLSMGAVAFRSDLNVTNVLFWEWNNSEVEIYRGENNLTLNTRIYARHRAQIQDKLGDGAKSAIAEFDI